MRLRGPLALAVLYVVPLVLWARAAQLEPRFSGQYATLTSVAVLFAFAGTSAFALNLVLGARLRPVEAVFGGSTGCTACTASTGSSPTRCCSAMSRSCSRAARRCP